MDKEIISLDRAAFNQGENAKYPFSIIRGGVQTIVARGPGAICCPTENKLSERSVAEIGKELVTNMCEKESASLNYVVRRLTPIECARLQGFPDFWGEIDPKEDFTDEEYQFWLEVRNHWAEVNGKQTKEYTKEQMVKWYNKLHTDSAEYKMWGNGIGLPNALYVMEGIEEFLNDK